MLVTIDIKSIIIPYLC